MSTNPIIPVKNPRSAALVGLTMDASDEEFRAAWQRKFPDQGIGTNAPVSFGARGEIIPDKLKVLAGFGAAADVTMDQIVAALENKYERTRQAKFQSLLKDRARELPNESYDHRFAAVARSEKGMELLVNMHRSGTSDDENVANQGESSAKFDPVLKDKAKREFQDLVDRLKHEGHYHDAWIFASGVHPLGRKLYQTWKDQADLEKKEALVRQQRAQGGSGGIGLTSESIAK